jgi:hypothetical protein
MNLLLQTTDVALSKIFFLDKKNNMIMDGYFTKLIFSNECMITNGLFVDFQIIPKQTSSKNMLIIDMQTNKDFIHKISTIEKQIIQYYMYFFGISNKTPAYNLKLQLQNGYIKYYKNNTSKQLYFIKISGIWETSSEIGITFKIIEY